MITVTVTNGVGHLDGYLTSEEYAKKYSIKEGLVRKYIYSGKLPAFKIGNGWWIQEDEPLPPKICNMKQSEQIEYKKKNKERLNPKYFKMDQSWYRTQKDEDAMLTENICCNCHWYEGVKAVPGKAPCSKQNKQVLWDEDCDGIWLIPKRLKIKKKEDQ